MTDLENLSPTERIALAEKLAEKGAVLGHELAGQGHPIVLSFAGFTFSHAGKQYTTGIYAEETLSQMAALAEPEILAEAGEPPKSKKTLAWIAALALVGTFFVSEIEEPSLIADLLMILFAGVGLMASLFLLIRSGARQSEHRERKAKHEWRRQVIAEPIWAGMRIALSEYEADRYEDQKKAGILELKRQYDAQQPYYPDPPKEPQTVSITEPLHGDLWNPPPYRFDPMSFRQTVSGGRQSHTFKQAESDCADWLRTHGEPSARLTKEGADGGVDIVSNRFVCQVKNYKGSVGEPAIRDLYGVSVAEGKTPLFFTTGTYTKSAIEFADRVEIALIIFDAQYKNVSPASKTARTLLSRGTI